MKTLEEKLEEAVETYNEYRSPMATAEILESSTDTFEVKFEGPFCTTCCRDDYFVDLIYELKKIGVDISSIDVDNIRQEGLERFVVEYSV